MACSEADGGAGVVLPPPFYLCGVMGGVFEAPWRYWLLGNVIQGVAVDGDGEHGEGEGEA